MMFGFVYMKTVGTYPRTIFFLIVAAVTTSFIFLSLVRLPDKPSSPSVGDDVEDVMLRDGDATETRFTG
jgi:hypothetical protein